MYEAPNPELHSLERLRAGARDLVEVARRSRMPVVGGLLVDREGGFQLAFLLVDEDGAGNVGFRDRMGRPVAGERAYGTELTVREARALAA